MPTHLENSKMNDIHEKAYAFGADFRARREAAGLTPTEVGRAMVGRRGNIGVQPTFIHAVERGQCTGLKASTRRRLNEALDRAGENARNPKALGDYSWRSSTNPNSGRHGIVAPIPANPNDVSRQFDAFDLAVLVLVSIAVGALGTLFVILMKGV